MGRYNFTALRVGEKVTQAFLAGSPKATLPLWLDAVQQNPPAQVLDRPPPQQHPLIRQRVKTLPGSSAPQVVIETSMSRPAKKGKRSSRMFMPVEMRYEEDELRKRFYADHPWELARPRVVVENDGKDSRRYDWSKIEQPGKRLDGESVVQRQLYLLNTVPDITTTGAYDIARREFYALRHREDIERRVAAEEALNFGAYFGKSTQEVSMQLEDDVYEQWKVWAEKEQAIMVQKSAAYAGATNVESETAEEEVEEVAEAEEPAVPAGVGRNRRVPA